MLIPIHDENPLRRWPIVTVVIIVVNVIVFLIVPGFKDFGRGDELDRQQRVLQATCGFVPQVLTNVGTGRPVKIDLYRDLPDNNLPEDVRYLVIKPTLLTVITTIITSMFMHADIWHLLGNMLFFWIFGNNIEDRLGHVTFTLFYLIGGAIADLCHWGMASPMFADVPVIGASGAVAVMLGAYIVTYPMAKVRTIVLLCIIPLFLRIPAYILLGIWIMLQLLEASLADQGVATNVAFWAHIGGFFTGMIVMPILAAGTPEPGQDWKGEAEREFDFSNIHPEERMRAKQAAAQKNDILWNDSRRAIPPTPAKPDIRWEDRFR